VRLSDAEISQKIMNAFQDSFPDFDGAVTPTLTAEDVPGWDSAAHVGFIVALEDQFGIEFQPEEYVQFKNIGELTCLIRSKV